MTSEEVVLVVRLKGGRRLAGIVSTDGMEPDKEFEGWIEFMGAVTDLKEASAIDDAGARETDVLGGSGSTKEQR